jgi:hypothetical protein
VNICGLRKFTPRYHKTKFKTQTVTKFIFLMQKFSSEITTAFGIHLEYPKPEAWTFIKTMPVPCTKLTVSYLGPLFIKGNLQVGCRKNQIV